MDQAQLDAIRYVRLAANHCDGSLTAEEFNEHAGPTRQTVCRRLNSNWNDVKKLAGLDISREKNIEKEDLCEDLHRVATIIGETPTYKQYNECGKYSTGPIRHRLGNGAWNDGLRACGLEPRKRYDLTAEDMKNEILRIADLIGSTPSVPEFKEYSKHTDLTVISKLNVNTWTEACEKVGLKSNRYTQEHVSNELDNVETVASLYEEGMTTQELATKYDCNANSISWRLKKHGVNLREPGYRSIYCDILNTWVGSKTERDFAQALDSAELLKDTEYHPDSVKTDAGRWEPDFKVNEWLVECKQGTWGEYTQIEPMTKCDDPILVYGLEHDIEALPHDRSITRVPGEIPDLEDVFE